jgi:membrane protein DedA with SNARE-associated domain
MYFTSASAMTTTWWQYAVLFLAVTASWAGVPVIGATAAGGAALAASQGHLNLAAVIIVTTIAAEAGGLIGYSIGSRWGREIVERPGKHQAYRMKVLAKGEQAYEKWGRIAVFFTPSMVSGTAKMPHSQFVIWNLLDALGFTFFTVGGAYGIGRIVTGRHTVVDLTVLILGVGIGTVILILVRRHHKRWTTQPVGS